MEMVHFIPPAQRRLVMLAAQTDSAPALICGSSGTGKGAIARWIHSNGPRATLPFVSASYDHSRKKTFYSWLLEAQGGTLVISEIGEWPRSEQMAILDFLKNRSIPHPETLAQPPGPASRTALRMIVNVRIIATTDQMLEGRAQGGLFNLELLETLNVFRVEMPPLSKRKDEFEDIVLGLKGEITRELHKEHLRNLSDDAWDKLRAYEWPGNLRELRNVLRLAVMNAKGDQIEVSDLPEFGHDRIDFRATREQFEKIYILELLKTFGGEIDKTCQMTRMDKGTLLSKIDQYRINLNALN